MLIWVYHLTTCTFGDPPFFFRSPHGAYAPTSVEHPPISQVERANERLVTPQECFVMFHGLLVHLTSKPRTNAL